MTGKKIIFYILSAFIAGNFFIIYIQYNSFKNTTALINGNEKVLKELNVSNNLKELEKDIFSVESKIRGTITTADQSYIDGLQIKINAIENNLHQLQKISDDDFSIKYIDELDTLVRRKILFSRQILNLYQTKGKAAAENLIIEQGGKKITDSIANVTFLIDSTRKTLLTKVTNTINKSGNKVQQLNSLFITLVLVIGLFIFWYIINTLRKQNQLIEQLNTSEKKVKEGLKLKEKFLANMSHEIRTPMNAILGFTNLLKRKNIDATSKEYVHTIQKSSEHLLAIINDILDLSKIEEGMMRIEHVPFNIRTMVFNVETMFRSTATEKQLHFFILVDDLLPDILVGDEARLTQILVNLIGNAFKFTAKGSIKVNITNEGINDKYINTGITITDTGIGIEKDQFEKVFERFHQAEDSVTRKYGGTGLGLSIVKDLVQLHKGNINVASTPNKGTTFKILIPYKIFEVQLDLKRPLDHLPELLPALNDISVLVAEDNEINQSYISHLFTSWKLKFDMVSNGKEAIKKLMTNTYNLILMDIQMPEMDGYTASQQIRNTLGLHTPIIAMTAHTLNGEREKCLNFGMDEYISKPIREDLLLKIIRRFTIEKEVQTSEEIQTAGTGSYKYIDLTYLKEISNGNIDFEKKVTEQFIEIIPNDLKALEVAWQQKNIKEVKRLAHDMITSVSIMGLNDLLQPNLNGLEFEHLENDLFNVYFTLIKKVCESAVEEAKQFYTSLTLKI